MPALTGCTDFRMEDEQPEGFIGLCPVTLIVNTSLAESVSIEGRVGIDCPWLIP